MLIRINRNRPSKILKRMFVDQRMSSLKRIHLINIRLILVSTEEHQQEISYTTLKESIIGGTALDLITKTPQLKFK